MDETRKRYVLAGVVVGTVAVGLAVLARRTPPGQWGETAGRVGRDVLDFVKSRYGSSPSVKLVEKALEQFDKTSGEETVMSKAFSEAAEGEPHTV